MKYHCYFNDEVGNDGVCTFFADDRHEAYVRFNDVCPGCILIELRSADDDPYWDAVSGQGDCSRK